MTETIPDIVSAPEIAQRLGVRPSTVHQWRQRRLLPEPEAVLGHTPVWTWTTIEAWAVETRRLTR